MNKKVLFGMLGLAAGSLMADNAVATFNPYVELKGGYSILSKKDNLKYKNGFVGAVEFGVSYESWRLGLEVAYRQNKVKEGTSEFAKKFVEQYTKINALSAMINVYYDYALTDECTLYVGAGLGAAKVSFEHKKTKVGQGKTVFAWQVMAGVAYDINENWTIQAGYRLFNTSKNKVSLDDKSGKVKMPFASSIELGLRYNF